MGLTFDAVAGELPLVQRVWSASCDAATSFTSAAKGSSMIAFARTCDRLTVHLRGPETRATQLICPAGWEFPVPSCGLVPICPYSRRPVWPT